MWYETKTEGSQQGFGFRKLNPRRDGVRKVPLLSSEQWGNPQSVT
jgi:hypothetical protein